MFFICMLILADFDILYIMMLFTLFTVVDFNTCCHLLVITAVLLLAATWNLKLPSK